MRKHRPDFAARAVPRLSGMPVRPGSAAAGSTWLLLGVVLAGLFAMHGLGTHGTHAVHAAEPMTAPMTAAAPPAAGVPGAEDAMASHSPDGHAAGADMAGSVSHTVRALAGEAAKMSTASTTQLSGRVQAGVPTGLPDGSGLLGLCFAVLIALGAWVLARGRALRVVAIVPRALELAVSRGRGRDRDPPSLLVLSVHRC